MLVVIGERAREPPSVAAMAYSSLPRAFKTVGEGKFGTWAGKVNPVDAKRCVYSSAIAIVGPPSAFCYLVILYSPPVTAPFLALPTPYPHPVLAVRVPVAAK